MTDPRVIRVPRRSADDIIFIKPKRRAGKVTSTPRKERALEGSLAGPNQPPSPSSPLQEGDEMSPLLKRQMEVMTKLRAQVPVVKLVAEENQPKRVLEQEAKAEGSLANANTNANAKAKVGDSETFTIKTPIGRAVKSVPVATISSVSTRSVMTDLPDNLAPGKRTEERDREMSDSDESINAGLPNNLVPSEQIEDRMSDSDQPIIAGLTYNLALGEQIEDKMSDSDNSAPDEQIGDMMSDSDEPIMAGLSTNLTCSEHFEERGCTMSDSDESVLTNLPDNLTSSEETQERGWKMLAVVFIASLAVLLASHLFL